MVEPLIFREENGDWALRERTHLGSVRHKFSLPPASLPSDSLRTKGSVVHCRYHTGSTIPQVFKLYVQTSLGIHIMTAVKENPNFIKSLFKVVYLSLLLPLPQTPERQIVIWCPVRQIKRNARHPSKGSKNTQEIANAGAPNHYCAVYGWRTTTAVYIQLLQWFVMISLFSSYKPLRPVCRKQTSPILWSVSSLESGL